MLRTSRGTQMILSMRRSSKGGSFSMITHGRPSNSRMSPICASGLVEKRIRSLRFCRLRTTSNAGTLGAPVHAIELTAGSRRACSEHTSGMQRRPDATPLTFDDAMDTGNFKLAMDAVWEAMAQGWDERHAYFEATAQPVTERMLAELSPQPNQTILDIAAGTGVVGFAAAEF